MLMIRGTLPPTTPVAQASDQGLQAPLAVTLVEPTNKCATTSADSCGVGGEDSAIISSPAHANIPQPNATSIEPISSKGPVSNDANLSDALPGPKDLEGSTDNDMAMRDATSGVLPSPKPLNDEALPPWLTKMISYLRGVAPDMAWQDLVTEFVEFEKCGPQNGVSPFLWFFFFLLKLIKCDEQNLQMSLRPKEVSDWIRSKKKDDAPLVNPLEYGKKFLAWWKKMQPSWRASGPEAILSPLRDVPTSKMWQAIRKGGTAGVYTVMMGLSWWIMAQHIERDANAWSIIDDLTWVIQQMKKDMPLPPPTQKRAHEGEDEDEGQRVKRYVSCPYFDAVY